MTRILCRTRGPRLYIEHQKGAPLIYIKSAGALVEVDDDCFDETKLVKESLSTRPSDPSTSRTVPEAPQVPTEDETVSEVSELVKPSSDEIDDMSIGDMRTLATELGIKGAAKYKGIAGKAQLKARITAKLEE